MSNVGFQLPFGVQPVNPVPVDFWSGPYSGGTVSDALNLALSSIPSGVRFPTMEVRLYDSGTTIGHKYWFKDGVGDNNLIEFTQGSSKYWFINDTLVVNSDDSIVLSNNMVLENSTLTINTNNRIINIDNLIFSECGQIFIGGYLLLINSNIINNGILNVAGAIVFSGSSTITGTGIIN